MVALQASRCPRCRLGMLIPGWEPGERSCISCGFELYPDAISWETAEVELSAERARRELKILEFRKRGSNGQLL